MNMNYQNSRHSDQVTTERGKDSASTDQCPLIVNTSADEMKIILDK